MIIGICGPMRHGKDTIGNFIQDIANTEHLGIVVRHSFAAPMKRAVEAMFGWTPMHLELDKDKVDPLYGITPRLVLQLIGTEFAQIMLPEKCPEFAEKTGRALWVKRTLADCPHDAINVITDVRFLHEAKMLRESGQPCSIVRVVRDTAPVNMTHASEAEIMSIPVDYSICNDGTLYDLKKQVYEYLKTLPFYVLKEKKMYISGPMTGYPNWNKDAFVKAKDDVKKMGFKPYTPCDITDLPPDGTEITAEAYRGYLTDDINVLLKMDAIYMLRGWEGSRGALLEKHVAEALGMSVYYEDKEYPNG